MASWRAKITALLAALLMAACASPGPGPVDTLSASEQGDTIALTVPLSKLVLTVPKGGLQSVAKRSGGATENPRYFYLQDKAAGLIVSGWFEPAERYTDLGASLKKEFAALKSNGFGDPQKFQPLTLGKWQGFAYEISMPNGSNTHVRASYVGSGTWIDLHASLTTELPAAQAREKLLAMIGSFVVQARP